jgi:hypothetical protein
MAAFSNIHFFESRALCSRALEILTPRTIRRRATDFAEIASRVRAAGGEALLIVWTGLALAFWLLILVGFIL